jgi:hypothetical protein
VYFKGMSEKSITDLEKSNSTKREAETTEMKVDIKKVRKWLTPTISTYEP